MKLSAATQALLEEFDMCLATDLEAMLLDDTISVDEVIDIRMYWGMTRIALSSMTGCDHYVQGGECVYCNLVIEEEE